MTTQRPEHRARTVAWLGLFYSIFLMIGMVVVTLTTSSSSVYALAQLAAPTVSIWFVLLLIYHQRVLVQREAFEVEELKAERAGGSAIFDTEDEQLRLAKRRLRWMYVWLLPFFTIGIILTLVVSSIWGQWTWYFWESVDLEQWTQISNVPVVGWGVGLGAFATFLMSRYVTGMSRFAEWRMLKAGASYFMGVTLAMTAVAVTVLVGHYYETVVPEIWLTRVLRVLMILLAAEFILNMILDFYRPKGGEEEPRPAFDSRFFGLFAEPGGIARSIAEAANYQFGFEISSTWFYKLLERSVAALLGFAVVTLMLASCFVFVEADEVAVIQRFGKKTRVVESGLSLKLPWPFGQVDRVKLGRVHELSVGTAESSIEEELNRDQFYLWTNEHGGEPHMNVLVATPELDEYIGPESSRGDTAAGKNLAELTGEGSAFGDTGKAVAVSLLRVAVSLQYRIGNTPDDAYRWVTEFEEPEKLIESVAMEEITRFCAGIDVDSLMGTDRREVEETLLTRIEEGLVNSGLDFVEIEFLALLGVHPPVDTAKDFQAVVGAEQKKIASIRTEEADYNSRLTEVAGTREKAELLVEAIQEYNRIKNDSASTPAEIDAAEDRVNVLFLGDAEQGILPVGGKAEKLILEAMQERWRLENQEYARATRFRQERIAKDAAPEFYAADVHMEALEESLEGIRKYVVGDIGVDGKGPILQLNLQDAMDIPIDVDLERDD